MPICRMGYEECLLLLQLSGGLETGDAWEALEQGLDSIVIVSIHPVSAIIIVFPVTSVVESHFRT